MFRPLFALSALALAAAPAVAASYSGKPIVPTTAKFIASDIVWTCGPAACQGATEESRPAVLCQSLAKRAGRLDSFIVDGRPFDAAALERCNSAAKAQANSSLAAQ